MGDYRKGVDYRDGGEITIDDPGNPLSLLEVWILSLIHISEPTRPY